MKLISLKSLLAALLGCAFVVIKAVTFDGLADMVWIILFGYLSVKCLVTAFSQEAYDEDVKQARQGKVLYRDLFGKFAYVATDIPIILFFFSWSFGYALSRKKLAKSYPDWTYSGSVGICYWVQPVCFKA